MIDLHTHILPGIDDGATDLGQAVAMCRAAAEQGFDVLVATPHQRHPLWWNDDIEALESARRRLQAELGTHPRIVLGAEVRADGAILEAVDSLSGHPEAGPPRMKCIGSSRYVLLEFGPLAGPEPESVVHEMIVAGLIPILAHPECLPWLALDIDRLRALVERGALLQITGMSVAGDFGRTPRDSSHRLLQEGLVHFLASDCHDLERRPPAFAEAARLVSRKFGTERLERITHKNPLAVIEDRRVIAAA